MPKVGEIRGCLFDKAPESLKLGFDNVGLLVGSADGEVSRILLALDITDGVIEEAAGLGAELVISHHPLFFELKRVTDESEAGRKIISLIENGISAICMHTNLDAAEGGVNDALLALLGAENLGLLVETGAYPDGRPAGMTRLGQMPSELPLRDFLELVKTSTDGNGLRYHDAGRKVSLIAVCGGSGANDLEAAVRAGCDTFVTADVKYDRFLTAKEAGINLIDADHFCTENVVLPVLRGWLAESWSDLEVIISATHIQTAKFY